MLLPGLMGGLLLGGSGGGGGGGGSSAPTDSDITAILDASSVWGDPSDESTLFQSSGGTTAVSADSDPVGYMGDKSGNAHNWTQATSGSRPLYKISGGNKFLRFNGTAATIANAFGSTWAQPNFVAIAFRILGNTSGADPVFNGITNTARNSLKGDSFDPINSGMDIYAGTSEEEFGAPAPGTNWHVALVTFDGASSAIRLDGTDYTVSATPGAESLTGLRLSGSPDGTSTYSNVDIGGVIAMDTPPSAEDQLVIEEYLARKVGIFETWTMTTEKTSFTPHDGIAYDGTYWYGFDTNAITKYDSSWTLLATNSDPLGDIGAGGAGSSLIDGYVYDGKIWQIRNSKICAWDTSDLSYLPAEDVAAAYAFSAVSNGPNEDYIYGTDLNTNNNIRVVNRLTGALVETITLNEATTNRQGLTYQPSRGTFFLNCDAGVLEVATNGTILRNIGATTGGTPQGMTYDPVSEVVFALNSGSGTVFRFTPTEGF